MNTEVINVENIGAPDAFHDWTNWLFVINVLSQNMALVTKHVKNVAEIITKCFATMVIQGMALRPGLKAATQANK
jgi:hypothetical protein